MKKLLSVSEAQNIIFDKLWTSNSEVIKAEDAGGRLLAQELIADRDLPPFNRVMMDGIAINSLAYFEGIRSFPIQYTLPAGTQPQKLESQSLCIEIMTGAVLPEGCDCVIRYEDLEISGGQAKILIDSLEAGQNVHPQGFDKKKGDVLASSYQVFRSAENGIAASIGLDRVLVKTNPRIAIISTGDELVEVNQNPQDWQIRRSNVHALNTLLKTVGISASCFHLEDDSSAILEFLLKHENQFDGFLFSGGVSKGKFDYLPQCFESAGFEIHVHGVKQRPGKPLLFASKGNKFIFGFPGNPVSTLVCAIRYFKPWLKKSTGFEISPSYARLAEDFEFKPGLTYFLEVNVFCDENAVIQAVPLKGHGSGDLANLSRVKGFLELPEDRTIFKSGDIFPYWSIDKYE